MRRRSPKLLLSGGIKHLTLGARFVGRRGAGSSGYSATSWESGSTESHFRRFVSIVTGAGLHDTDRNLIYQLKPINSDKQTEIPDVMHRSRLRGG
jgi:hypothetical protein